MNNEPWFCLADGCMALGLEQVSGVKSRLNANGVTTSKVEVQTGIKLNGKPAIQMQKHIKFVDSLNVCCKLH